MSIHPTRTKVLVIGKAGQLARALSVKSAQEAVAATLEIRCAGRPEVDLCDSASLGSVFADFQPQYVINAAAYTAVDKAESDEAKAFAVNAVGVKHLADCCRCYSARLFHISTDYVFDGSQRIPLIESDEVAPLGAYGRSKLAGEWAAQSISSDAVIIRTSWVYGDGENNFVRTMLKLAEARETLGVVADQFGRPTYAGDLADFLVAAIQRIEQGVAIDGGVYHYSNAGEVTTWHGFAEAIFLRAAERGMKAPSTLNAISTEDYPTPAERPKWSVLDIQKTESSFGITLPEWQDSLDQYFNKNYAR